MSRKSDRVREELVEMLPRLCRFAHGLTRDVAAGDDLTQATVERVLSRWNSWDGNKPLRFWVFKIAKNLWLDQLRAQKVRGEPKDISQLSDSINDETQADMETTILLQQVSSRLNQLPEEQHLVLMLVAVEGYSYKETAELLEIPIGTVMSRLSRARAALIDAFD